MQRYHGAEWKEALDAKKKLRSERLQAAQAVRELYPDVLCSSLSSRETAPRTSTLLRRADTLLVDASSYAEHFEKISQLCLLGSRLYADTFTREVCGKIKTKVNLLKEAYETIAEDPGEDGVPAGRDHPDVGHILAEMFLLRFEEETDREYFSPGARSVFEA